MQFKLNTLMNRITSYESLERVRSYSSVFSRKVFMDILHYHDFSHLNWLYYTYDQSQKKIDSYYDYILYLYNFITRYYRCEYVFKNEIINQLLLKKYGTENSIAFNEFKVGKSVVDFAVMNGESKAFEIKTQFDSPKRLSKQMEDYQKIFNKCYVVVSTEELDYYKNKVDQTTGIIELYINRGKIKLKEHRPAIKKMRIDIDLLMQCLRTQEYKNIVSLYDGDLPKVNDYCMYDACKMRIKTIPLPQLNDFFLQEIKKRRNVTNELKEIPKELRQICLSLNLSKREREKLMMQLNDPITKSKLCISRI